MRNERGAADAIYRAAIPWIRRGIEAFERDRLWLVELAWALSHDSASGDAEVAEAIQLAQEASQTAGRPVRNSLQTALAKALLRTGRHDDAITTLREGLADRRFDLMSEWLPLERLLIRVLREQDRTAELEEVLRDNIDYRESFLTPTHPATLEARVELARWFVEQDRTDDAIAIVDDLEQLARHNNTAMERSRSAMETLVTIYTASDQLQKAKAWQAELDELGAR
jgi:hypothetical protein